MNPPSSCRARQLQARQPRRIPRFIVPIHNRRIHSPASSLPLQHVRFRARNLHALAVLLKESMHCLILTISPPCPPICPLGSRNLLNPIPLKARKRYGHPTLQWDNSPRFPWADHASCNVYAGRDGDRGAGRAETVFVLGDDQ